MKDLVLKVGTQAGLGDCILSLLQGVAYSKLSGRKISVDWRGGLYGMPAHENLFDRLFELTEIEYGRELPVGEAIRPAAWSGALSLTFHQLMEADGFETEQTRFNIRRALERYSFDHKRFDYEEDILVAWDHYQFKHMMEELGQRGIIESAKSIGDGFGQIYRRFVRTSSEVTEYLDANWSQIVEKAGGADLIGVHVRETAESFAVYGPVGRRRYFNAIENFLEVGPSEKRILLATDNAIVRAGFVERYGNMVLVKEKWFNDAGKPLHLAVPEGPDRWNNVLDAVFEMYALSRCHYLVRREESSFSRVAQCIGFFPGERAVVFGADTTAKRAIIRSLRIGRGKLAALARRMAERFRVE